MKTKFKNIKPCNVYIKKWKVKQPQATVFSNPQPTINHKSSNGKAKEICGWNDTMKPRFDNWTEKVCSKLHSKSEFESLIWTLRRNGCCVLFFKSLLRYKLKKNRTSHVSWFKLLLSVLKVSFEKLILWQKGIDWSDYSGKWWILQSSA